MSTDTAALEALHGELRDRLAGVHHERRMGRLARRRPPVPPLLPHQPAAADDAGRRRPRRARTGPGNAFPTSTANPCQVRRHEHGLIIRAPLTVTRRDTDEATGEQIVVAGDVRGYRNVKVFHQGQLVAPPDLRPRPLPTLLTGPDRWQHVWNAVCDQLGDEGYPVELHTASPGETWNGRTHFDDGFVEVMDHLDSATARQDAAA